MLPSLLFNNLFIPFGLGFFVVNYVAQQNARAVCYIGYTELFRYRSTVLPKNGATQDRRAT